MPGGSAHSVRVGDLSRGKGIRRDVEAVVVGVRRRVDAGFGRGPEVGRVASGGVRRLLGAVGIRPLRRAVGQCVRGALGGGAGPGEGGPAALLRLLDAGRGPGARSIRGDRPGPRGPDVTAGVGSPASDRARRARPIRRFRPDSRQPSGRPSLDRGPPRGLGIDIRGPGTATAAAGPSEAGRTHRTTSTSEPAGRTTAIRTPQTRGAHRPVGASALAPVTEPGSATLPRALARVVVLGRYRVVPAERLLRRPDREAGQHDAAVVADEDRAGGDVAVDPAVGVQDAQGHQDVGGDLGRPVRRQRLLGEEGRQRPCGHQFADDPQRTALGEHVEDLVEPGVVGNSGRGLRGLDGTPYGRIGGPPRGLPHRRASRTTLARPTVPGRETVRQPCREPVRQPLRVEHLGLDDLRQRHLPDQDFLPAVGVEGPGLGEFVLVGRRQRQAVAVGEYPTRIVVHVASPGRPVGQIRSPCGPLWMRTVRNHSRYVPEATRTEVMPRSHAPLRRARHVTTWVRNSSPASARCPCAARCPSSRLSRCTSTHSPGRRRRRTRGR